MLLPKEPIWAIENEYIRVQKKINKESNHDKGDHGIKNNFGGFWVKKNIELCTRVDIPNPNAISKDNNVSKFSKKKKNRKMNS